MKQLKEIYKASNDHYELIQTTSFGQIKGYLCEADNADDAVNESRLFVENNNKTNGYLFNDGDSLKVVFVHVAENGNVSVATVKEF